MSVEMTNQTKLLHHIGDRCRQIGEISEDTGLSRHQISMAATALITKGLLERTEVGCFQLTDEGRAAQACGLQITSGPNGPISADRKPLINTLRQRAWNVIRMKRKFAIPDLLIAATMGDELMAKNNLQRFCRALCRAGVIRQLPSKQRGDALSSPGFSRYALVDDLGPIAPSYRQSRSALFDHNAQKELRCE